MYVYDLYTLELKELGLLYSLYTDVKYICSLILNAIVCITMCSLVINHYSYCIGKYGNRLQITKLQVLNGEYQSLVTNRLC